MSITVSTELTILVLLIGDIYQAVYFNEDLIGKPTFSHISPRSVKAPSCLSCIRWNNSPPSILKHQNDNIRVPVQNETKLICNAAWSVKNINLKNFISKTCTSITLQKLGAGFAFFWSTVEQFQQGKISCSAIHYVLCHLSFNHKWKSKTIITLNLGWHFNEALRKTCCLLQCQYRQSDKKLRNGKIILCVFLNWDMIKIKLKQQELLCTLSL